MAVEQSVVTIDLPASGDLSSHQYKFMICNSSGQAALAGNGGVFVGILQNKPSAAGQAASIAIVGRSKVVQSASLTVGNKMAPDASGLAEAFSAGDSGTVILLENGGAANAIGSCLLFAGMLG